VPEHPEHDEHPAQLGPVGADASWLADRAARAGALLVVAASVAVLVSYGTAGLAGLVISLSAVAALGLVVTAMGLPGGTPRPRPVRLLPSFDDPYPTFQRVSEQLSWSQVSPRHYDLVTRPLLVRLMASRLAEHHGIDLARSPEAARAVVGDDLWWWLDPTRQAQSSSQPPGVDVRVLTRLVERLETL
jgi:hypothetical protein